MKILSGLSKIFNAKVAYGVGVGGTMGAIISAIGYAGACAIFTNAFPLLSSIQTAAVVGFMLGSALGAKFSDGLRDYINSGGETLENYPDM